MKILDFGSLDELQLSLAARLRTDATESGAADVLPVIGRLLIDEAHSAESRIAVFRVLLSVMFLGLAIVGRGMGSLLVSPPLLIAAAAWGIIALGLAYALRGNWFPPAIRRVIPVADAAAIVAGATFVARGGRVAPDAHTALAGVVSVLCAFLVFSGALRLTRSAAVIGSTLAVGAFLAVAIVARLDPLPVTAVVGGLLVLSALSRAMTDAVRRVIATEIARIRLERQMESADRRTSEAQAASRAREEVLRIVAHDLRNPLGTLLMAADLVADPSIPDAIRAKQALTIKRVGARMNHLIQDLLNVARMETGRLEIERKPVPPSELLGAAAELMRPIAAEKGLELAEAWPTELPMVQADAERITQVFSNLIGNAVKFTPAGGRITLSAEAADGRVWFSVTDTGPGIPREQVVKVFGEFWQARRGDARGIGLGLTIAKGIVEAHEGTIGVDSEVGVGTKFWFAVPYVVAVSRTD